MAKKDFGIENKVADLGEQQRMESAHHGSSKSDQHHAGFDVSLLIRFEASGLTST